MTTSQLLLAAAVVLCGASAVFLGSPLTTWVFRRVDHRAAPAGTPGPPGVLAAVSILKGGRTIGLLERTAVFVAVLTGWPEGLAVVIALKGLGRFAELRGASEGAAERFLIGSFTSLLFASLLGVLARVAAGGL